MIDSLADWGVEAEVIEGLTGVWVGGRPPQGRKIGSIGVHVSRGVTTHGFALNVNNDLQPFEWIVPCGIEGCRMTSLAREHGAEQSLDRFMDTVTERFAEIYEREPVTAEADSLAEHKAPVA
jgi:lipoyl(octanoyl) transferase